MKIERLLSMTIMLLNRRKMTAKDLADYFEVSILTIYRDVQTLNMSAIPVVSFQGYGGGFCIPDHYKLSRQLLTFSDMLSILTTLKGVNKTLNNKDVSLAIEKITALIPKEKESEYRQYSDSFLIDINPWGSKKLQNEIIGLVHNSVTNSFVLKFTYTPVSGKTNRRNVEPYTLVFKGFAWYLLGFCRLKKDFRVFKLSRMQQLTLTNEHFVRRQIDPSKYFDSKYDKRKPVKIVLKFPVSMKLRLQETFSIESMTMPDNKNIILTILLPWDEWIYSFILSYGEEVEVISPERLRAGIAKKITNMKNNYKDLT